MCACMHICVYIWMHTEAYILIWDLFVFGGDAESLVLTRALRMSIVPSLITETSRNVPLCTCAVTFQFLMQQSHHT